MGLRIALPDEGATRELGAALARVCAGGLIIYLEGSLGAGKSTLARGLLHGLGHPGAVKSPTYTLIEPYEVAGKRVFHLDLYRLADPEELEYLGMRDLLDPDALVMIEWPEKGAGFLPLPDIEIRLEYVAEGRVAELSARTGPGAAVLGTLRDRTNSAAT